MSEPPSFLELEKRVEQDLSQLACKVRFNAKDWNDLAPVLLFLSVLEGVWTTCLVGKAGFENQVNLLLRHALEQHIKFTLVCKDEQWIENLRLEEQVMHLTTLKRAKDGIRFFKKF
ncbi:hypothetical protein N4R57_13175 [Rhodobacteraceae bacterium D3-12]|nr:hypothetical protein N4R57_13175 [Rhodobacteraceae bacterium D3-12]